MMIKPSVYVLGSQPPTFKKDPGAGVWNSQAATIEMKALKEVLTTSAIKSLASYFGGDDAVKHLAHYLSNAGGNYTIDFAGLIREAATAKKTFDIQIAAAKAFVETLPLGKHKFTSSSGSLNHYITKGENVNWFFAVGSYTSWGKGVANVVRRSGKLSFEMDFEYHFFDRYNWDKGKSVDIPIPGYSSLPGIIQDQIDKLPNVNNGQLHVTDKFMGDFHRQGLAKEFDMIGTVKKKESWRPTAKFVVYSVKSGDTLSKLAKEHLGDASKWSIIHAANKTSVPNPNLIRVGQKIKIPT